MKSRITRSIISISILTILLFSNQIILAKMFTDIEESSAIPTMDSLNKELYDKAIKAKELKSKKEEFEKQLPSKEKPIAKEETSQIESILSGKIPSTIDKNLKQFGYDLFEQGISTFAPIANVPVGLDYILGPGDELIINIWGKVAMSFNVIIDRNGNIFIPKVGAIVISGLSFSKAENLIYKELSKIYTDFSLNITMGELRTMQVFVLGEIKNPGCYTVSSLATLYNALYVAGGPSKRGTMRKIKLIRNNKEIKIIDLYDFLLEGDKSNDIRLENGDTIFVPVIGPVVGITGCVHRSPYIYEFKDRITLAQALNLAGGIIPSGYTQRIQIERIEAHKKRIVYDINYEKLLKEKINLDIDLYNNDIILVAPISSKVYQYVNLEGNVLYQGKYELKSNMKLSDIISEGKLLAETYFEYAEIIRLISPDFHPKLITFNLGKLLNGDKSQDLILNEFDTIKIYSKWEVKDKPMVSIKGYVRAPGIHPLSENMKISDLIIKGGNLKEEAYLDKAELSRILEDGTTNIISVNLRKALNGDQSHDIKLEKNDVLFIRMIPEWLAHDTIKLEGEFKLPGEYVISKNELLSSVIKRAGGFTEEAFLKGAIFIRKSIIKKEEEGIEKLFFEQKMSLLKEEQKIEKINLPKEEENAQLKSLREKETFIRSFLEQSKKGRMVIKLTELDKCAGSKYDISLERGDYLFIPKKPNSVIIIGSVYNPGAILHKEGAFVNYYLKEVGGITKRADKDAIHIMKVDGSARSSFLRFKNIEPGDMIVVPETLETKITLKKSFMDTLEILFKVVTVYAITKNALK
ncbi:MAG: SLBB domain-containing protein [bacterium]|nr:SLBB domain-containing protein [bacterium]